MTFKERKALKVLFDIVLGQNKLYWLETEQDKAIKNQNYQQAETIHKEMIKLRDSMPPIAEAEELRKYLEKPDDQI